MSQDWTNNNANFYLDNFGTDEITIPALGRTRKKSSQIKEHIQKSSDPILDEQMGRHKELPNKVNRVRKTRKVQVDAETERDEYSRTCDACGKVLASTASLYVHYKSHSTNKPYICNECGANFTRKYYLEVHLRSHTGEKPFKCDVCGKHFSQKSSLNTHKRKHTGEKPFECGICNRAFSAQSYLVSHQWTHYQKVNGLFSCTSCNFDFESRIHFAEHARTHAKDLKFACKYCPRKFAKECHLIRHRNATHGKAIQS